MATAQPQVCQEGTTHIRQWQINSCLHAGCCPSLTAPALAALALAQMRQNPNPEGAPGQQEPSPEPSTQSSRIWGALHPSTAPRELPPWPFPPKIGFWQLEGLGPTSGSRGDTQEPFPSCPRAAFALTHPDVSHSPPHTYSIITSALAPLWEAYLTPNPSQSSPKR